MTNKQPLQKQKVGSIAIDLAWKFLPPLIKGLLAKRKTGRRMRKLLPELGELVTYAKGAFDDVMRLQSEIDLMSNPVYVKNTDVRESADSYRTSLIMKQSRMIALLRGMVASYDDSYVEYREAESLAVKIKKVDKFQEVPTIPMDIRSFLSQFETIPDLSISGGALDALRRK